jgi:hypothetical protein
MYLCRLQKKWDYKRSVCVVVLVYREPAGKWPRHNKSSAYIEDFLEHETKFLNKCLQENQILVMDFEYTESRYDDAGEDQ